MQSHDSILIRHFSIMLLLFSRQFLTGIFGLVGCQSILYDPRYTGSKFTYTYRYTSDLILAYLRFNVLQVFHSVHERLTDDREVVTKIKYLILLWKCSIFIILGQEIVAEESGYFVPNMRGRISRRDVTKFMLDCLEKNQFLNKPVAIAVKPWYNLNTKNNAND